MRNLKLEWFGNVKTDILAGMVVFFLLTMSLKSAICVERQELNERKE